MVVRLGGFHICENFLGAIGFFVTNSGIENILAMSGVCKLGTANKVMAGQKYYQIVRCHSLMSEAMLRLLWNVFQRWLNMEDQSVIFEGITDSVEMLH